MLQAKDRAEEACAWLALPAPDERSLEDHTFPLRRIAASLFAEGLSTAGLMVATEIGSHWGCRLFGVTDDKRVHEQLVRPRYRAVAR